MERVAWCELPDCADRRYIDAPSAYTLKAFGDGVAWATTTGDYVYGASDGGAKVLGANYAGSIATSGRRLYATTATTMVYCAENGCGAALWAVEPGAPAELSSGAGWLAWTLTPSGSTTPLRWIRASTTAGLSDPGGPHTLVEEPDGVAALAVDGASVYWAKKSASGGLFAASLESAGPRVPITLVSGERINSVAVGVREVFYTNAEAGSVSRVRIEGGASPVVVSRRAGGRPSSVRIREPFVYWIEKTDGSLRSARIE